MSKGRFGIHGGQYIPETLMNAVNELEEAYRFYKNDPAFNAELEELLKQQSQQEEYVRSSHKNYLLQHYSDYVYSY